MATGDPRPLIGLTCYTKTAPDWAAGMPARPVDYIFRDYPRGVEAAGGLPILIPLLDDCSLAREILPRLDGLIFTGGLDVAPSRYGEDALSGLQEVNHIRDELELALFRAAMENGLPILGICRGLQIINVALGGTLYQDLASQLPGVLEHQQSASKEVGTHRVRIEVGSRFHTIIENEEIWVNTGHHQAVKDLAPGLKVVARATDGVIEAVEKLNHGFLLAVQWHPEGMYPHDRNSQAIFKAFIQAARK